MVVGVVQQGTDHMCRRTAQQSKEWRRFEDLQLSLNCLIMLLIFSNLVGAMGRWRIFSGPNIIGVHFFFGKGRRLDIGSVVSSAARGGVARGI